MKLEVEKNQVMKKCHYCAASKWNGECACTANPEAKLKACYRAINRLVEAEKGR